MQTAITIQPDTLIQATTPSVPALPLDQHPAAAFLAGLAFGSRRTMRQSLDTIARELSGGQVDALGLSWASLRFQHTTAIRARLADRYAAATANKMLTALRRVLQLARDLGQMTAEDCAAACQGAKKVKGEQLPAGRGLSAGEVGALLATCRADTSPGGARDAALIAVLYGAGLRRAELCALDLADYDQAADCAGALTVRHGKGNKARAVPLPAGTRDALADWLEVRGDEPGPLLCPVTKGERVILRRLNPQSVFDALQKRAAQAGVSDVSPHDFRRTFASDLLDAGADIVTVQRLMGHADPATTGRYDRRGEEAKRKAVELLHVPYRRRYQEQA